MATTFYSFLAWLNRENKKIYRRNHPCDGSNCQHFINGLLTTKNPFYKAHCKKVLKQWIDEI